MSTIKDVAKKVGVSTATVSHVVNKTRFVSEAISERVLQAIRDLNYQPNAIARSLVKRKTHTIGIIITDILMPKLDGYAFVQKLRLHTETRSIPVIFLSATYVTPEDKDFALSLGAARFMEKPIDTEDFLLTVAELVTQQPFTQTQPLDMERFYNGYRTRLEKWSWIFFFAGLSGCMSPISKGVMARGDKGQTFSAVMQNPAAYINSTVLWGGVIEKAIHGPEGTELIVRQAPLDSKGYPQTDSSEGEFIAHTLRHLNPEIFLKGMKVTVGGEIDDVAEIKLGPQRYPCPRVQVIEIHAWTRDIWGIFPIFPRVAI